MSDDDDLPLNVPLKSIEEFFSCPICMGYMVEVHTTFCGHRYCGKCIRECVGRLHKCPCCNTPLTMDQLIKDAPYDHLIDVVKKEREKAEKIYFDNLISAATDSIGDKETPEDKRTLTSPLEDVLKKHLKTSLNDHNRYLQDMKREFERKLERIKEEHEHLVQRLHKQPLPQEELEKQEAEIVKETGEKEVSTITQLQASIQEVADAYDRFLADHVPSLSILPVKLSVAVMSKSILIDNITLKPQDSLNTVHEAVRKYMHCQGDSLVKIADDVQYLYFSPFAKRSLYEMHQIACDIVEHGATNPDITKLPADAKPVIQCNVKPGGVIALYGAVQCQSDQPRQCFKQTFQEGQVQLMDYFQCQDCAFKWICRSCMEVCHRDHKMVPYIMNHQPTWACCYCPKKKKCTICN